MVAMDMSDPATNLFLGLAIGIFLGVGLAYLVVWGPRRQAKLAEQHVEKHKLKLSDKSSIFLISSKLSIIFDQSELIISDIRQDNPERIQYSSIESVSVEWQKWTEKHLLTIKTRAGQTHSHRVLQAYHHSFSGQPATKHREAVMITDEIRSQLESAGVTVTINR